MKTDITLSFDDEKLEALELCLKKENSSVKKRMDEALRDLYEKSVPEPVREYLDSKATASSRSSRRRPSRRLSGARSQVETSREEGKADGQ